MQHLPIIRILPVLFLAAASTPNTTKKWVGPTVTTPNGVCRTVIYYGPWQCSEPLFDACTAKCRSEGRALMGCIWIADLKVDCEGSFLSFFTSRYGGRAAIDHCCCDYPRIDDLKKRRDAWNAGRDAFRIDWAKDFGEWPKTGSDNWQGHHIHDLAHGGAPTAPGNVIPAPNDVHYELSSAYLKCYAGTGDWRTAGAYKPYTD